MESSLSCYIVARLEVELNRYITETNYGMIFGKYLAAVFMDSLESSHSVEGFLF